MNPSLAGGRVPGIGSRHSRYSIPGLPSHEVPSASGRRLADLLAGTGAEPAPEALGLMRVSQVTSDSRRVRAGSLFVAIRGQRFDGHDFLPAAAAAGAAAALVERRSPVPLLPEVQVPDTRRAAGPVAAAFHRQPSRRLRLAGVTGTNGKTTVAWLLAEVLQRTRGASFLCGTVGHRIRIGKEERAPAGPSLTTREAPDFQAFLAEACAADCGFGAVECSSHGLAQGRLDGTSFEVAVFTNLTRDHLDFHPGLEAYFQAKRRLFTELLRSGGAAVLPVKDPFGERLAAELAAAHLDRNLCSYGYSSQATVRQALVRSGLDGIRVRLETPTGAHEITSPLLGGYNAENLAAAWAAAAALGVPGSAAAAALSEAGGPPGRMERIAPERSGAGPEFQPAVLVDYAHTPDALARALAAARGLAGAHRLTVVFGCGGGRDRPKRALMGAVAARLADRVLLTSDNPRSEDPEAIIADIRQGTDDPALDAEVGVEPDRRAAISRTVESAAPGELVLLAGRGHETHQESGGGRTPLDDRVLARAALRQRAGRGPAA